MVEILLVVAIILLVVAVGSPIYGNLLVSTQLNDSTDQMRQWLRTSRLRSVEGLDNMAHGVYFEVNEPGDDRMIMYEGSSYALRNSDEDQVWELDSALSLSASLSGNEVNFAQGTGVPDSTGIVTIMHRVSGSRSITINKVGLVD